MCYSIICRSQLNYGLTSLKVIRAKHVTKHLSEEKPLFLMSLPDHIFPSWPKYLIFHHDNYHKSNQQNNQHFLLFVLFQSKIEALQKDLVVLDSSFS